MERYFTIEDFDYSKSQPCVQSSLRGPCADKRAVLKFPSVRFDGKEAFE